MLTAGSRAPPFGDLAKCATAAGADAGAMIQRANSFTRGWRALLLGCVPRQIWEVANVASQLCCHCFELLSAIQNEQLLGVQRADFLVTVERRFPTPNQLALMLAWVIVELKCNAEAVFHPLVE